MSCVDLIDSVLPGSEAMLTFWFLVSQNSYYICVFCIVLTQLKNYYYLLSLQIVIVFFVEFVVNINTYSINYNFCKKQKTKMLLFVPIVPQEH